MRHFRRHFLIQILIWTFLAGCSKNQSVESFTETVTPVTPDFGTQVIASVNGFVVDEQDQPIAGALVAAGNQNVLTNEWGYFSIKDQSFPKAAAVVKITKAGYFNGIKTFTPEQGKTFFCRISLLPENNVGGISGTAGGSVNDGTGGKLILPANATVDATSNQAYTGTIQVAMHLLDPSQISSTQAAMPGDLRGIDTAGYFKHLVSFGMLAVTLKSSTGALLQLAPNKKATLHFPIAAGLLNSAPQTINLWYFDENKGVWKQEGTANKVGQVYIGEVAHFTYWNCDIGLPLVAFNAQIVNESLQPLVNSLVSIAIVGSPNSTRYAYTDTNGYVNGFVPANAALQLTLPTACQGNLVVQNFQTSNANVQLGTLVVNTNQLSVTVTGNVLDCTNAAVADGYVYLNIGNVGYIKELNSQGSYTFTGLACAPSAATITAVNRTTSQQSQALSFNIQSGINPISNLVACNQVATEQISYVLDGNTTVLNVPQHLFSGLFDFAGNTTEISAIDFLNGNVNVFKVMMDGADIIGNHPVTGGALKLGATNYVFVGATNIAVSAYSSTVGGFIKGSFSGTIKNTANNTNHTFSCTFSVKRDS